MTMSVTPYLFFDGRCEEAIEFYKKTLGAEVKMMMRFKDAPDKTMCTPGTENKVMHACLSIGGTDVMASDGRVQNKPKFEGFALSISPKDEADAERLFKALADGGQVQMPLAETFFAKSFGMVADRFGVGWMIIVEKKA
jgi:PhnB protein